MKEVRYFGLRQWGELREFTSDLLRSGSAENIKVRGNFEGMGYVVEWDEKSIDLENK